MLSSDDAHYRRSPSVEEAEDQEGMFEQMQTSVWGGKQGISRAKRNAHV
jgi:hypothetical protein